MGKLIYGSSSRVLEIDDRVLVHLKVVVLSKLRRGESFALSWAHGIDHGSGRSTLWMHQAIPVQFMFNGNRRPTLDRQLIDQLIVAANSPDGIDLHDGPIGDDDRGA